MLITTVLSLKEADICFFHVNVTNEQEELALGLDAEEIIGHGHLPSLFANRLNIAAEKGVAIYNERPIEFIFLKSEQKYYENLNVSDQYFSECYDRIITAALGPRKPYVWVCGPRNLSLNLSYTMAKHQLAVFRQCPNIDQHHFVIVETGKGKSLPYRAISISKVPTMEGKS